MRINLEWNHAYQPYDGKWELNCGEANCGEMCVEADYDEWWGEGNTLFSLDDADHFEYEGFAQETKESIETTAVSFFKRCFPGCQVNINDKDLSTLLKTTPIPENDDEESEEKYENKK